MYKISEEQHDLEHSEQPKNCIYIICYSDVECKMIYFVSAVYTIDIGTAELPLIANTVMAL